MLRGLITVLVLTAVIFVVRWAWRSVRAWMRGELTDGFGSSRRTERGWKVEQDDSDDGSAVTIKVMHPRKGVRRSWTIDMTEEGARKNVVRARADAEALAAELNGR